MAARLSIVVGARMRLPSGNVVLLGSRVAFTWRCAYINKAGGVDLADEFLLLYGVVV